jgi:hypothetical protein
MSCSGGEIKFSSCNSCNSWLKNVQISLVMIISPPEAQYAAHNPKQNPPGIYHHRRICFFPIAVNNPTIHPSIHPLLHSSTDKSHSFAANNATIQPSLHSSIPPLAKATPSEHSPLTKSPNHQITKFLRDKMLDYLHKILFKCLPPQHFLTPRDSSVS